MSLMFQTLRHYWRLHLGYVLAIAIACSVLTGGLMVGDALRAGLALRTERRLGPVDSVMVTQGRWFSPEFSQRLREVINAPSAAVFMTDVSIRTATDRLAGARLVGADQALSELAGEVCSSKVMALSSTRLLRRRFR